MNKIIKIGILSCITASSLFSSTQTTMIENNIKNVTRGDITAKCNEKDKSKYSCDLTINDNKIKYESAQIVLDKVLIDKELTADDSLKTLERRKSVEDIIEFLHETIKEISVKNLSIKINRKETLNIDDITYTNELTTANGLTLLPVVGVSKLNANISEIPLSIKKELRRKIRNPIIFSALDLDNLKTIEISTTGKLLNKNKDLLTTLYISLSQLTFTVNITTLNINKILKNKQLALENTIFEDINLTVSADVLGVDSKIILALDNKNRSTITEFIGKFMVLMMQKR